MATMRGKENPTVPAPQDKDWFPQADWLAMHEDLKATSAKQGKDCEVVFLGDSITQGWLGEGLPVWNESYAKLGAVNLGIGGDEVQHVLWRVQNGEVDGITNAKVAVVLIGTNNIGNVNHSAWPVAKGVRMLLDELTGRLPTTKILLMATFPRDPEPGTAFRKEIDDLNETLRTYRDGRRIFYLDIATHFYRGEKVYGEPTSGMTLTEDIMPDYLHLSTAGYHIWADSMSPILNRLLAAPEPLPEVETPFITRTYEGDGSSDDPDGPQTIALFAAGMRFYHNDHGISDTMRVGWEKYIQHAIDDDMTNNMKEVYLGPRSNFWCVVDQRLDSESYGDIIGIVGGQELDDEEMELRRMSVHINSRGLGLASHLVDTLEQYERYAEIRRREATLNKS